MKTKIISKNIDQTNKIAEEIAINLPDDIYILLSGDLGAGKTTFTKQLLKVLGIKEQVTSPTFNILNQYEINDKKINHMDAYRLNKKSNLEMFEEEFDNSINIIEWWENINLYLFDKKLIKINIKKVDDSTREFFIERI